MPIPKEIEKNLGHLTKEQWEIEKERIFQKGLRFYNEKVEKNDDLKKLIGEKINPKKLTIPTLGENGQQNQFNEQTLKYFEKNQYFLDKRKEEIKLLLNSGYLTEDAKMRLMCELKFLEIKDVYVNTRENILNGLRRGKLPNRVFEKLFLDRSFYKREKP